MGDDVYFGGPIIPSSVRQLEAAVRDLDELAGVLRAGATRQATHLRALHRWTGRGHQAWTASVETTGRAALAIAAVLGEAAAIAGYLARAVHDLRWRAATLAARARAAGYDVGPDGTVQPIGIPLVPPMPGLPPPHQPTGPTLPVGSSAAFEAKMTGRALAAGPDPWRAVQLEVAGLIDDACTAYAAASSGLHRLVSAEHRASTAPPRSGVPDGGGFPVNPLAAAVAAVQLPGEHEDLWDLVHRGPDVTGGEPPGPGRVRQLPAEVARVVADRRLSRAARMNAVAGALDRIVAAAGKVPVVPAAATVPVSKVLPVDPKAVLSRLPIVDVALAGWSVHQDVASGGYGVADAIGRETVSTVGGYAAAEGAGYAVVVLGGPAVTAAIVAVGVGYLVGQVAGALYDKATHHGR